MLGIGCNLMILICYCTVFRHVTQMQLGIYFLLDHRVKLYSAGLLLFGAKSKSPMNLFKKWVDSIFKYGFNLIGFFTIKKSDAFLSDYLTD